MEEKTFDLKKTVYELCTQYPELVGILSGIGFTEITKPGMLTTAGRFMTVEKGCSMRKIDIGALKTELHNLGFKVI